MVRMLSLQVLFAEASAQAGHTVDKVITVVDASGLRFGALTGGSFLLCTVFISIG